MIPRQNARSAQARRRGFAWRRALVGCLLVVAATARAETFWLRAAAASASVGARVDVELVRSRGYGEDGEPVTFAALASLFAHLDGQALGFEPITESADALHCPIRVTHEGIADVVADFRPITRTVPAIGVERYLREIHATDDIRAAWANTGSTQGWRERRHDRVKTFVRAGDAVMAPARLQPLATGFDLEPVSDPTRAVRQQPLTVRVFRDGQPVSDCVVEYLSLGGSRQHVVFSDADGRAEALLEVGGSWLVQATDLRRVHAPDHDWEVERAALTVFVP